MPSETSIKPTLFRDEPAISWLCRWAEMTGRLSVREFAQALGVNASRIASGEDTEILARVSGLPEWAFLNSTILCTGNGLAMLRGHSMDETEAGRLYRVRFCPACVHEDTTRRGKRGEPLARLRTAWGLRCVNACPEHGLVLHDRRAKGKVLSAYPLDLLRDSDPAGPFDPNAHAVPALSTKAEAYVLGRFGFGEPQPSEVLDGVDPGDLPRFLREAGMAVIQKKPGTAVEANVFYNEGFEAVATENAFRSLLERLDDRFRTRPGFAKHSVTPFMFPELGRMFDALHCDGKLESLRTAAAEYIAERYPTGGDRVVYGVRTEKRLYSFDDLYRVTRVHEDKARKVLSRLGIQLRGANGSCVDAGDVMAFRECLSGIVGIQEAAAIWGTTITTARDLVAARVIEPWSGGKQSEVHKFLFDRSEVERVVADATRGARSQHSRGSPRNGLLTLREASARPGLSHAMLVAALLEDRIECAGLIRGLKGLAAILIRLSDTDTLVHDRFASILTITEATALIGTTHRTTSLLASQGYLGREHMKKGAKLFYEAAVNAFRYRYVSAYEAGVIVGTHARGIKIRLGAAGIYPAMDRESVGAYFFERDHVVQFAATRRQTRRNLKAPILDGG